MAQFDDFQRSTRASTRLIEKQTDPNKLTVANATGPVVYTDVEEAPATKSTPTKRTFTPRRKAAAGGSKRTTAVPTLGTKRQRTTGIVLKAKARPRKPQNDSLTSKIKGGVATRKDVKRKLSSNAHDVGKSTTTAKRQRLSSTVAACGAQDHGKLVESVTEYPIRGSSPLFTPPQSPVLTGAQSSSLASAGDVAPGSLSQTSEADPTEASKASQIARDEEVAAPAASVANLDSLQAQIEPNVISTPAPDQVSQLLTPPVTAHASDSEERSSPNIARSKRSRKKPDFFGNIVPTASAVEVATDAQIAASTDGLLDQSPDLNDGSSIDVAPKPKQAYRKRSTTLTTQQTSQPLKTTANSKVTQPRAKATPKPRTSSGARRSPKTTSTALKRGRKSSATTDRPTISPPSRPASRSETAVPPSKNSRVISLALPPPNAQLLALSQKLCRREPLASKPEPRGRPEVWADSRQALCETLPYFKKPQGGCYQNDGHVYGFLFDSVGHCREYMDEDVIICRAGGSMESDGGSGMVQRKDQTLQEAQVQAVLNDIAHHNPVIVICGNRNEKSPTKMPHVYSVLGWYKPVAVWSEKTAGKGSRVWTTVKYRLERLNQHKPAWHAPKSKEPLSDEVISVAEKLTHKACEHCQQEYPQIFLRSWICLNQRCEQFWKVNGEDAPLGSENMEYNPAYLLHRSKPWASEGKQDEPEPSSLRPALPNFGNTIGDNLTYINTRGICCPKCGRCSSRRLFSGWVCENSACDYQLPVQHRLIHPTLLHTPWDAAPTLVRNRHAPGVRTRVEHKHGYKISTYTFDGIDGRFIHAAATRPVIEETNGADDMFRIMQSEDIGLERRTFGGKKMSGGRGEKGDDTGPEPAVQSFPESTGPGDQAERAPMAAMNVDEELCSEKKPEFADGDLMTAFSMNYGMPYKFVACGASKSFDGAPEAVTEARRRLNWAAKAFLQTPDEHDFNELLIFGYLQGQKIEYHDDGEEGLGPHIAALSLGGRAKMHMRMKMKHHIGCSKTGVFTEERPVPGGMAYTARLQAWNDLQPLKTTDAAAYTKRRKEIPKELGIYEKRMKKAEDLVTVSLSHGDIVLMDGYDIQKYLEHKVVPEDHLRFALTCRTVLENHLKPEERPDYAVERDEKVYAGPSL